MSEGTDRYERFTETNVVGSLLIYEWVAPLSIRRARDLLDQVVEIIGSLPDVATVVDGTAGKDYLHSNFVKRDVINKKDWQSVSYLWKRSPEVLSDFAIEIGCSTDRFKLFEIHIDRAAVLDLKGTLQRIVQFVSDELQPSMELASRCRIFGGRGRLHTAHRLPASRRSTRRSTARQHK